MDSLKKRLLVSQSAYATYKSYTIIEWLLNKERMKKTKAYQALRTLK